MVMNREHVLQEEILQDEVILGKESHCNTRYCVLMSVLGFIPEEVVIHGHRLLQLGHWIAKPFLCGCDIVDVLGFGTV